jgi:putative ABC transport system ATP-binding protein
LKKIIDAKNIIKTYDIAVRGSKFKNSIKYSSADNGMLNIEVVKGETSKFKALDKVSLSIMEGEFTCVMGPSGSGKSTLISILSTIDSPTIGKIKVNGENVIEMSERKLSRFRYENIGYIFQEFNLLDNITIRDNIALPLLLKNVNKKEIYKRVEALAEKLDIVGTLDKLPSECSGGQKQRAASARALISEPKIIIADEPTGNLDSKNSHELLKILKERNEKQGTSILMVTHDAMIASYSKKLVFIRDGKIETELIRGDLSQKEFFYKIVDITSKESQNLFNEI